MKYSQESSCSVICLCIIHIIRNILIAEKFPCCFGVSLRKYGYPHFIKPVTEEWSERVEVAEQRRNGQSLNQ